ncbi:A/G-specific adenine glycosylase [Methylomarinum sp. Ch1-1]|uniref:Adenine DNA glycosylase n=1 Tax=Methylomarinum roseum TaxID=3067653 RepID=A0AAU7NW91_9GAMM|nr:A/G-specific adenine glycosylase [Methylomarinum sp. Ch1-1]MDP4522691.1 A/G-specific adenine glycosylase [Methylomarinum sp. Ch1-1]
MTPEIFQRRILGWFDRHGRKDLPWQQNINPYRVWVSEIMLQQTQVATVIPYFQRFMVRFPDVFRLAEAPLDEVLQHWAGLGYYARARNLHKSARIVADNGGVFPDTLDSMSELPGIGRSTAGAILSIACGQSHPILDGNVRRVLARFHGIHGWSGDSKVNKELWSVSRRYTPLQRTADYTQAMMDMGATLCTRSKPNCDGCPLGTACFAFRENKTDVLPTPKPRQKIPVKQAFWLLLKNDEQQVLLQKRPPSGIWGGLWSLPEFVSLAELQQWCLEKNYPVRRLRELASQRHTFSHYHLDYTAVIVESENPNNNVMEANLAVWYKTSQIDSLGLPAPVKRLLQDQQIEEEYDENG